MGEETLPCWGVACPNLGYARKKISTDIYEELAFKTLDLALILLNLKTASAIKMNFEFQLRHFRIYRGGTNMPKPTFPNPQP